MKPIVPTDATPSRPLACAAPGRHRRHWGRRRDLVILNNGHFGVRPLAVLEEQRGRDSLRGH